MQTAPIPWGDIVFIINTTQDGIKVTDVWPDKGRKSLSRPLCGWVEEQWVEVQADGVLG